MNIPAPNPIYTTKYEDFRGVDFTSQSVERNRFPYAKNFIITDMVEKRPGWKVLKSFGEEIFGIFNTVIGGTEYYLVHAGDKLYYLTNFDEEPTELITGINQAKSTGFFGGSKYYILTGKEYIEFDGTNVKIVNGREDPEDSFGYNPLVFSGRRKFVSSATSGTWTYDSIISNVGGEVVNETANLMSRFKRAEYQYFEPRSTNATTNFRALYILPDDAWSTGKTCLVFDINGKKLYIEAGYIQSFTNSQIANATSTPAFTIKALSESTLHKDDVYSRPDISNLIGKPFTLIYETEGEAHKSTKIYESTATSYMQYGNGVYFFLTGNSNKPNTDWQSALNDPTYFPADRYMIYGTEDEVLGYGQYGQYLAVFKKGNRNTNIYVRYAQYIESLGVTFPSEVGVGGAMGGISSKTISNLEGETLYLTKEGIFALTSLSTTNHKVTRNRSYFIDNSLLKEENLENAVACTWENKYIVAVNGKMYILNGSLQKTYIEGFSNDYAYECLFWDNIPATTLLSAGSTLYFGTSDGDLCVFTKGVHEDNGEGIETIICTKLDDDGDYMSLKKLKKKGTGLLMKPYARSSCDIFYRYDSYEEIRVRTAYGDIFSFNDIDFDRFTFESNDNPRVIPFLKKSKKYKSLQIIIRSNNKEPLGLMGLIKRYEYNNYTKR